MSYSVAADEVLDGCWSVVDQRGVVALRTVRMGRRHTPRPAVFRTRAEADACARRWNDHLAAVVGHRGVGYRQASGVT
jgi:hypothetical protein